MICEFSPFILIYRMAHIGIRALNADFSGFARQRCISFCAKFDIKLEVVGVVNTYLMTLFRNNNAPRPNPPAQLCR